jgi:serine phosphatase RsbU (regulator of sigma subunit)
MRSPSRIAAYLVVLISTVIFTPPTGQAEYDIDSLYHEAMTAYQANDIKLAESIASLTLSEIESQEGRDWIFRGERKPLEAEFSGDYILIGLSDTDDDQRMNRVEVYLPENNELMKIHDFSPWYISGAVTSKNYIVIVLRRDGFLGYKLSFAEKGEMDFEKSILCLGKEEYSISTDEKTDYIRFLETGPHGVTLSVLDLKAGEKKEVHTFEKVDVNKALSQITFKIVKDTTRWLFLDGSKLYALDLQTWRKKLLQTLPFEATRYMNFWKKEMIQAVFGDTLYVLPLGDDGSSYDEKTVHLPFPMDNYRRIESDVDDSGMWLSHSDPDSLRIYRIIADTVQQVVSTASSFGSSVHIYWDTGWLGDTLFHWGNAGLQIYKGAEPLYKYESDEVHIIHCPDAELLYLYEPPNKFSMFDPKTLKILWTKHYEIVHLQFFQFLGCDYVFVNHAEGTSVLDARSGNEVFRSSDVAIKRIFLNQDTSKVAVIGDNFLGVFDFPSRRKLKSDLTALSALHMWEVGDSAEAVHTARRALGLGTDMFKNIPKDLLNIFSNLKLDRESLRLMGTMALKTEDPFWQRNLKDAGLTFLTPRQFGFVTFPISITQGIIVLPLALTPIPIIKGAAMNYYWLEGDDYIPEEIALPITGFNIINDGLIFYKYALDSANTRLSWEPLLLTWSGEFKPLGQVFESPLPTSDPNDLTYPWFEEQTIFNPNTKDRAVVEVTLRNPLKRNFHLTAGLDLTGRRNNWADSTLRLPIRIGGRYYAHEYYGDCISRIYEESQADSIGIELGDIVVAFGDHSFTSNLGVGDVKNMYPLRTPIDLTILRGDDTLHFDAFNGFIGYEYHQSYKLIELDPETGEHLTEMRLPPTQHFLGSNSSGELVYTCNDSLRFLDPQSGSFKTITIPDLNHFQRYPYCVPKGDNRLLRSDIGTEIMALNISKTADDSNRVLWKQEYENIYQIGGLHRFPYSDDDEALPLLLNDGTLLIIDIATGLLLARENLPFRHFGYIPQVLNGVLTGSAAGRIFGWKVAYYHPPFPWTSVGYGALAFLPLLIASVSVNRMRINRLKRRQVEELERERIRQEIETAAAIQRRILPDPDALPVIEGFTVYGQNYPCKEVGGDYFDVIPMLDARFGFVVCDVSGKGLPAALLVSSLQATLHTLFQSNASLVEIARKTNTILCRNTTPDKYATGFIGIIDPQNHSIETVNAGHNIPLLLRASGELEKLTEGGLSFGILEEAAYVSQKSILHSGDLLYIYTDGISEALTPESEEFGIERLEQYVVSRTWEAPRQMLEEIEHEIRNWTQQTKSGNGFTHDDFTQLAIQVVPA